MFYCILYYNSIPSVNIVSYVESNEGLHESITISFMLVGHTKFSPDWCFCLLFDEDEDDKCFFPGSDDDFEDLDDMTIVTFYNTYK